MVILNKKQFLLILGFAVWGALLYTVPPVLQPYSASVLLHESLAYSLLYLGLSLGGLFACVAKSFFGAFFSNLLSTALRIGTAVGASISLAVLLMSYSVLLHQGSSQFDGVPRQINELAGIGYLSPSFLASVICGAGISCLLLYGDVDVEKSPCRFNFDSRHLSVICFTLGLIRTPLMSGLFYDGPTIFDPYISATTQPKALFAGCILTIGLFASIAVCSLYISKETNYLLEGYFLGEITSRAYSRLFLNNVYAPVELAIVLIALYVTWVLLDKRLVNRSRVSTDAFERNSTSFADSLPETMAQRLTQREAESIALLLQGMTSAEVAKQMGIKASSARGFQQRAYKKLGVQNADGLRSLLGDSSRVGPAYKTTEDMPGAYKIAIAKALVILAIAMVLPMRGNSALAGVLGFTGWSLCWAISCFVGINCLVIAYFAHPVVKASVTERTGPYIAHFEVIEIIPIVLTGILMGELWRSSVWPYSSLVSFCGVLLFMCQITYVSTHLEQLQSKTSLGQIFMLMLSPIIFYVGTGNPWSIEVGVGLSLVLMRAKDIRGLAWMAVESLPCLGIGLLLSSFCVTSAFDTWRSILFIGVEEVSLRVQVTVMVLGAGAMILSVVLYITNQINSLKIHRHYRDAGITVRQIKSLFEAMGLSADDAQVGCRLVAGDSGPCIARALLISLGSVNAAKKRIYPAFKVHSALELAQQVNRMLLKE